MTLALPMRGHVQVRCESLEERRVTLLTLEGHPLAGAVRFLCEPRGSAVRFQVEVYDRPANMIDFLAMRTVGDRLQDHTWSHVVEKVVQVSGGTAPQGVEHGQRIARRRRGESDRAVVRGDRATPEADGERGADREHGADRGGGVARPRSVRPFRPRPRSRRAIATGSASRSRACSGCARTSDRTGRRAAARRGC